MPILMRGRACQIDASRATESTATTTSSFLGGPWGPTGPVGPIGAVESNGVSTELYGRIFLPIQLLPECLSASSATAAVAVLEGPPQSSDATVGLGEPIRMDLLYRRGVL